MAADPRLGGICGFGRAFGSDGDGTDPATGRTGPGSDVRHRATDAFGPRRTRHGPRRETGAGSLSHPPPRTLRGNREPEPGHTGKGAEPETARSGRIRTDPRRPARSQRPERVGPLDGRPKKGFQSLNWKAQRRPLKRPPAPLRRSRPPAGKGTPRGPGNGTEPQMRVVTGWTAQGPWRFTASWAAPACVDSVSRPCTAERTLAFARTGWVPRLPRARALRAARGIRRPRILMGFRRRPEPARAGCGHGADAAHRVAP